MDPAVQPTTPATTETAPPAAPAQPAPQADALTQADIKTKNELRKEMTRVAAARESLAKERAAIEEFQKRQSLAAVDPDAFLKPVYGDKWYETLTKAKLGDDSSLAVQQLRQELESKFKAQEEQRAQEQAARDAEMAEEKAKADEEAKTALEEYRSEATAFVKEKAASDYQVIAALGLENAVADKATTYYQQTKKVLTHKEAADLLEQELDKSVEKVLGTPKWQEKLGKKEQPATQPPQFGKPRSAPTTISNEMRAGAAPQTSRKPTREEKLQRAMDKLSQWEAEKAKAAQ